MKKLAILILTLLLCLSFASCGGSDTIIGRWETESEVSSLGLSLTDNFISTVTRISFLEEGVGTWEIELVQTREILRREFSFTLEGDTLLIIYPDETAQKFSVAFDDGILLLTGQENLALKRIGE